MVNTGDLGSVGSAYGMNMDKLPCVHHGNYHMSLTGASEEVAEAL